MESSSPARPARRIGTICVDRGLISEEQLAAALEVQAQTQVVLGEILVARFGVTRIQLADVLAEQWAEMSALSRPAGENGPPEDGSTASPEDETDESAEDELRVLLQEAESARADLARKTDELSARLAALEHLVVGVNEALVELRTTTGDSSGGGARAATNGPSPRPARKRASTRAKTSSSRA